MKIKSFFTVFLLVIISININNIVNAKQGEGFIIFLTGKIYNDCKNEDLIIKPDSLLDLRNGISFKVLKEEVTKWPNYIPELIKEILEIFDSREKFPYFVIIKGEKKFIDTIIPTGSFPLPDGTIKEIQFDGRDILKCGDHILDINGTDYYWDNRKIELPKNVYNQNSFSLFGISLISNGGLAIFSLAILSICGITFVIRRKRVR